MSIGIVIELLPSGISTSIVEAKDLASVEAEDNDVVVANSFTDFNIGAVESAEGDGAVHHEFHIASARGFFGGSRNLFGNVGGGVNDLANGDAKVFNEDNLQLAVNGGVVVNEFGDGKNEADSFFGNVVARGSLSAEKVGGGRGIVRGVGFEFVVLPNDVEDVHQLAFVGVNALDLDIENGVGINVNAVVLFDVLGKADFANVLDFAKSFENALIVDGFIEKVELFGVTVPNARINSGVDKVGKFRICAHQPAAVSNAVGFVVEHTGPVFVKVVKGGTLQNVGVNTSNAVDGVRTHDRKARHVDKTVFNDRHCADFVDVIGVACAYIFDVTTVNFVDDHINAGEEGFEHVDWPRFQSFGHDRVVCVGASLAGDCPSFVPLKVVIVHENAHKFSDAKGRMSVVDMDSDFFIEFANVHASAYVVTDYRLNAS